MTPTLLATPLGENTSGNTLPRAAILRFAWGGAVPCLGRPGAAAVPP